MGESDMRKKYLEADGYYNGNESYILREPSDEYKEEFFECCKESDIMKERLNEESYRDLSWKTLFIVGLLLFVIDKRYSYHSCETQLADEVEVSSECVIRETHVLASSCFQDSTLTPQQQL